ncbi:ligand-binding sensor domain-containing protein [Tellurirhabdus bombi]|uniref:ligand-binding sensor domain-containing protein n=1 Tax=Tellurirhabdus bombi TaxID=2907205 RepID=UPI001F176C3D|nr:sensor histidine kinase [Tellurirhabdus bombi]
MKNWLLLAGFWLFLALPIRAQNGNVFLDQIAVEHGLSQSQVQCILKDARGYMWFGTQYGLNRYDGYQLIHYKHDPFDKTTLAGDDIRVLRADKKGYIWIGTTNGLCRFDPVSNRFMRLEKLIPRQVNFASLFIYDLQIDHFGAIWLATNQGLKRLITTPQGNYQVVEYPIAVTERGLEPSVQALLPDRWGALWIGTEQGLTRLQITAPSEKSRKKTSIGYLAEEGKWQLPNKGVRSLVFDAYGMLWVGTQKGAARLDPRTGRSLAIPAVTEKIGMEMITSLLMDHTQTLWIGTYGKGIARFALPDHQRVDFLNAIQQDVFSKAALKSGSIECLYEGSDPAEDLVWIGTYDAGVQTFSRSKNTFRQWKTLTSREQASTAAMVFSICTDRYGDLWLGTYEGLQRVNRKTHLIQRYLHQPADARSLSGDKVNALLEDRKGQLWVGTSEGLQQFNRASNTFETVSLLADEKPGSSVGVLSLFEDKAGNLWIGSFLCLKKRDARTGQITTYRYTEKEPNSLRAYMVSDIEEDRQGNIWIGTWIGLNKLNPRTGHITHYENNPANPSSLISSQILGILRDQKDQLWFCSGKGLSRLVNENGKEHFVHYTERTGLPNSMVYGALEDRKGQLWLSTNFGLSCLNPSTGQFQNYEANDGLAINEFNMNAYHQSKDGELFFGGIGLAISFLPEKLLENLHRPRMVLTSFKKFEKPVNIDSLLIAEEKIVLQPGENFFSFAFAALDFTNPAKNQYAYQLEGFHDSWISSGTRRYVSFTNLKPGDYILKVKGSNSDGHWNEAGMLRIPITVLPPFWQTAWFIALVLIVGMLIARLVYNYRVRKKVEHLLDLERVTLAENERVRKMAAQDLHDEFGNTITRISMLTEIIKAQLNGHAEEIKPLLAKISDNSNRLYQGTRDFIWSIDPEHDNLYEIAIRLKDFGDDIFDKTGVLFRATGITDELHQAVLPLGASRHLIFLFKEAMSNTLKHAQASSAEIRFGYTGNRIEIILEDNGIGLPETDTTPGNGLLNIRSRAKRIGGDVTFLTHPGGGASVLFRAEIPGMSA